MTLRQGYILTFPDGRTISDDGLHDDRMKTIVRMLHLYGATIKWGPKVKRPPKKAKNN